MPLASVTIQSTANGSRLIGTEIHTAYHLDVPVPADDLKTMIIAATKTPDEHPRVELSGVMADRIPEGVRIRVVASNSHFDIPWPIIARGIQSK